PNPSNVSCPIGEHRCLSGSPDYSLSSRPQAGGNSAGVYYLITHPANDCNLYQHRYWKMLCYAKAERITMRTNHLLPLMMTAAAIGAAEIRTVHFQSEDHQTRLVAYLFEPQGAGP